MQLQVMTRRLAEAIEKMVRPPMQADVKLKNESGVLAKLWWALRALACETLIEWGCAIAPRDYDTSIVIAMENVACDAAKAAFEHPNHARAS
jgi:hypothetical protein